MTKKVACLFCLKPYTPKQFYQRFCSAMCRLRAFRERKKVQSQKGINP
ncbi:hypothetical protein [Zavarzinella formosa]|nr:hypothetical protein [Zavarzinella formosa]